MQDNRNDEEIIDEILEVLGDSSHPDMGSSDIYESVGIDRHRFYEIRDQMIEDDLIRETREMRVPLYTLTKSGQERYD